MNAKERTGDAMTDSSFDYGLPGGLPSTVRLVSGLRGAAVPVRLDTPYAPQ